MPQALVKFIRRNRMNPRAQRLEPGKRRRKRIGANFSRGIRDRRKSKRGSGGRRNGAAKLEKQNP